MADQVTRNFFPALTRKETQTSSSGSRVVSYSSDIGPDAPILLLVHGYPQSAAIWRYIVPALQGKISLFVPELPGYGISTAADVSSKAAIGTALLEALKDAFQITDASPRKVILGGHDRGARVCHRLAVSRADFPFVDVIGAIFLDIVPTKVQWEKFADPAVATVYFHWPLLANVDFAVELLKSFGGGKWCRLGHFKLASTAGLQRMMADGAIDAHAKAFEREDVLRATCEDYAAGSVLDTTEQEEDQRAGRKVDVPLLVMFSKTFLGSRIDVEAEWKAWVKEGTPYEGVGVGEGYGHYLPEEAHDIVGDKISSFIGGL